MAELLAACGLRLVVIDFSFFSSFVSLHSFFSVPPHLVGLVLVQINFRFWRNPDFGKALVLARLRFVRSRQQ